MKVILLHHLTTLFYYRLDKETASSKYKTSNQPQNHYEYFQVECVRRKVYEMVCLELRLMCTQLQRFQMFIYVLLLNVIKNIKQIRFTKTYIFATL